MGNDVTLDLDKLLRSKTAVAIAILILMVCSYLLGFMSRNPEAATEKEEVLDFIDGLANLDHICIGMKTGNPNSIYCINENMTLNEVRERYKLAKQYPYGENIIYGLYKQVCK